MAKGEEGKFVHNGSSLAGRSEAEAVSRAFQEASYRRKAEEAKRALRQSEHRYCRLLAAVTSYTYTVRFKNGTPATTEHSSGCFSVTGYSPSEYLADPFLWIRMVYPDDRDSVRRHVAKVLACRDVPAIEHRIIRKDGACLLRLSKSRGRPSGRRLPWRSIRAGRCGCRGRPCCGCGLRPAPRTRGGRRGRGTGPSPFATRAGRWPFS